jgi:RNA polymerase sigma-70 factor (ECF subfamily)
MAANAESLFAEHHERLYRYLCRAAGQTEAARDLTQDVFLRVSRTAVPVATRSELQAWLFRVARNVVIDYLRQRRRTPEVAPSVEGGRTASQDTLAAVNEALARLHAGCRSEDSGTNALHLRPSKR